MLNRRAAPAFIALAWFVGGACAQPAGSAAVPSAAPEASASDDPTDGADWRARLAAARQRHAAWAACVAAKRENCAPTPVPDPMDALLNDDTLVNGDVVSTPNGLKVFRGQPTVPHSLADFQ